MSSLAYDLYGAVSAAIPNNGEWHQLSSLVRNIDGVFQCAELLIRRFPGEASMASGVNTDIHLQALDDMAKSKQVTLLPAVAADLAATIRNLQQQLAAAREALRGLIDHVDCETCTHEETHRGGHIWTICDCCGRKWADDEGGFVPHQDAPAVAIARATIDTTLQRDRQP